MNTISNRSHTSNQTFPETVMLFDDFIKARHLDTSRTHTQNDIIDTSKEESNKKNTKRQKKQLSPLSARVFDTETQEITTLTTKMPKGSHSLGCASVGTKIYIFGGIRDNAIP